MIKRVLLLAREFVNGETVSEYAKGLAVFLSERGIETHIVCFGNTKMEEILGERIHIHRVPLIIHGDNLFNWSMLMNNELKRRAREIFEEKGFDVIHGNDWITSTSAISIAKFTEKPLVVTIHSTEKERGFSMPHSGLISDLEWWLTYEAGCVISNNDSTYWSLRNDFQLPEEKIRMMSTLEDGWQGKVLEIYDSVSAEKMDERQKASVTPSIEIPLSNERVKQ